MVLSDVIIGGFPTLPISGFFRRCWTLRGFLDWMYPAGGGGENVESAALGVLILWTTWFAFNAGSTESITGVLWVQGHCAPLVAVTWSTVVLFHW